MTRDSSTLDLRKLRVFLVVADTESFTAAAPHLYMSQPAVSQTIAQLERDLGHPLFVRLARGVRLNEAGQFVRARARAILEEAEALERDLQSLIDGTTTITIGAFPTAGIELLPGLFSDMRARNPNLKIQIKPLYAADPVSLLREQEADYVLMFEYSTTPRPIDPAFTYAEVTDDPLLLLLSATHSLADSPSVRASDLADEPWVLRAHRAPYERIHDQMFRTVGIKPPVAFWTDDYQSLQGLVAAGVGVSIVPSLAAAQLRDDIVAVPLRDTAFSRRIVLVAAPGKAESEEYRMILSSLRSAADSPSSEHGQPLGGHAQQSEESEVRTDPA